MINPYTDYEVLYVSFNTQNAKYIQEYGNIHRGSAYLKLTFQYLYNHDKVMILCGVYDKQK